MFVLARCLCLDATVPLFAYQLVFIMHHPFAKHKQFADYLLHFIIKPFWLLYRYLERVCILQKQNTTYLGGAHAPRGIISGADEKT